MKKTLFIFLGVVLVAVGISVAYMSQKQNERQIVLDWSGLQEVPVWANDIQVEVKGGGFSREFTMTFTGPTSDIEAWIKNEKVFAAAELKPGTEGMDESVYTYVLEPKGGAQYAEIMINKKSGEVKVRVYWS